MSKIPLKRIAYILCLLLSNVSFSQNTKADSMLTTVRSTIGSEKHVQSLISYCEEYKYINPDTCLKYLNSYFASCNNVLTDENVSLMNLEGDTYWHLGDFTKSIYKYETVLAYYTKSGYKRGISQALGNIGYVQMEEGKFPEALVNYKAALKIAHELKDKEYIGVVGGYIAQLYDWLGEYNEAVKWYHEMKEYFRNAGDKKGYGVTLLNIGAVHGNKLDYDSALYYYNWALNEIPKDMERSLAIAKINIAYVKQELGQDLQLVKKLLDESMLVFKKLNSKSNITITNYYLGIYYMKIRDFVKAKHHLFIALTDYKIENQVFRLSSLYDKLVFVYEQEHKIDSAYSYYKLYKQFNDSLLIDKAENNMSYHRVMFETDKKQLEIQALEQKQLTQKEQLEREKTQRFAMVAGIVLLIVFGVFMYNRFRVTQKQKQIIEVKEKETQYQKHLVEEKQKEIIDSINYAKRIQYALLASDNLLNSNLPGHFVLFRPKDVVSGDFYWATPTADGFIYVTADCTGHGVPGAFMSLLNISKLSQAINENRITRPDLIFNNVRSEIIKVLNPEGSAEESKDGMDAILCKLDLKNMKLEYAAANNSFYIIRENQILNCKADKMPVGKGHDDNLSFTYNEVNLQQGDTIYTLTDGYADQFGGPKGKKFKYKQLEELLLNIHQKPMEIQKEILFQEFSNWKGELEQVDDVCIIGVKV